jgi:hypothetical protein
MATAHEGGTDCTEEEHKMPLLLDHEGTSPSPHAGLL